MFLAPVSPPEALTTVSTVKGSALTESLVDSTSETIHEGMNHGFKQT